MPHLKRKICHFSKHKETVKIDGRFVTISEQLQADMNKRHEDANCSDAKAWIKTLHTDSDANLQQKHRNSNLQKSFDSSLHRVKSGLTCYKYTNKT